MNQATTQEDRREKHHSIFRLTHPLIAAPDAIVEGLIARG